MKKSIYFIILICSLYAVDNSVALIDFASINIRETDVDALTQRLNGELIKMGEFTVLERSLIQQVIEEQKFQYSGNVDIQTVSDIGSMTGADYVIVGTISKIGGKYFSVDCRMIEVETSSSVRSASYDADDIGQLLRYGMKDIASQLSEIKVSDSHSDVEEPKVKRQDPISPQPSYITKLVDKNKTESWYYYFSYSLVTTLTYPDDFTETRIDLQDGWVDEEADFSIELIGVYRHISPKIIGGFVYDYSNDYIGYNYTEYGLNYARLNLSHSFIGLSVIGYLSEFGDGVFYKVDYGRATINYKQTASNLSDDQDIISSGKGTGFGFGIGYSLYFKQLKKTRAFVSLNYSFKNIDKSDSITEIMDITKDLDSYTKMCLNLGFIF